MKEICPDMISINYTSKIMNITREVVDKYFIDEEITNTSLFYATTEVCEKIKSALFENPLFENDVRSSLIEIIIVCLLSVLIIIILIILIMGKRDYMKPKDTLP